jgi:hypothetical protein
MACGSQSSGKYAIMQIDLGGDGGDNHVLI